MPHSFLALSFWLIASVALPKSAAIVDSTTSFGGDPIGNVKVTFTDGHTEMWTLQGKCQDPNVSSTGLVGWTRYTTLIGPDYPEFNDLRVCWPDGHYKDYMAPADYPFIEQWNFADSDANVIVKTRAGHGPAYFMKYELATGKLLDHVFATDVKVLPAWAQPFADP